MIEQRPYRGKPIDTKRGEWVFGWYLISHDKHYIIDCYGVTSIAIALADSIASFPGYHEVHPKTVGRAIELKDKSDVEIYINDIYLYYQPLSKNGRQIHKEHRIVVQDDIVELFFLHNRAEGCHGGVEIIGNAFDNPEFLGAEIK